jgi:hypothetical protein
MSFIEFLKLWFFFQKKKRKSFRVIEKSQTYKALLQSLKCTNGRKNPENTSFYNYL